MFLLFFFKKKNTEKQGQKNNTKGLHSLKVIQIKMKNQQLQFKLYNVKQNPPRETAYIFYQK